jgi:hypothetical protein
MIKSRVRRAVKNKTLELQQLADHIAAETNWSPEKRATHRKVQTMLINDRYSYESNIYSYWAEIEECSRRRLHWATVGWEANNGKYSILGAQAGSNFGLQHSDDLVMLDKINDWDWLRGEFKNVNV